jgi:hypothetical protein
MPKEKQSDTASSLPFLCVPKGLFVSDAHDVPTRYLSTASTTF